MSRAFDEPGRGAGCLSDLVLDVKVAEGHLAAPDAAHLETCAACAARLLVLEEQQRIWAPDVLRLAARAKAHARPRARAVWARRLFAGLVPAACAAAALVFFVVDEAPPDRSKGVAMSLFVQRDGEVFIGASGDAYQAGDAFRFRVRPRHHPYFMLVGVDGHGRTTVFYPLGGDAAAPLEDHDEVPLDASLVLDDAPEQEFVLGVFADRAVTAGEVARAVAAARARDGRLHEDALHDVTLDAELSWVVLNKGARQ